MNTPLSTIDEQIELEDLIMFSTEELKKLLLRISAALGETFHEINGYAQGATQIEAQFEKLVGLERHYKKIWEELQMTVSALIVHILFSDQQEVQWKKLAHVLHEDMTFLQAVTSDSEITSQWLAERDALAAQTASVVEAVKEEAVRQCEKEQNGAFLLLLQDVGIIPMWQPSNRGRSPRP